MKNGESRYCRAAWPSLADEKCFEHRHTPRTEALARALAQAVGHTEPTDEQVGWFMDDAGAIVDDFTDPGPWVITDWQVNVDLWGDEDEFVEEDEQVPHYATATFTLNGERYLVPEADFEPARPIRRSVYRSWFTDQPERES